MNHRVSKPLSHVCVLVLMVLAIAGCAGNADESTTTSASRANLRTTETGKAVESVKGAYKIFTGPRGQNDELPPELVPPAMAERLGIDPANARYAGSFNGARVYVVPARRVTCLFSEIKAITFCWNTWTVARGYGTSTVLCGEGLDKSKVATFGLVPHGVHQVTIVEGNGSRVTVPARNNVYVGETSSTPPPPLQIEWVRYGQGVEHPIRDSFKVSRGGC